MFFFSFLHGCRKHFSTGRKMNAARLMTCEELHDEIQWHDNYIATYPEAEKLVVIHECTWDARKRKHPGIVDVFRSPSFRERLHPRRTFLVGEL